jgi:DNA (cytosine-5)-methyltransferase 1
MTNQNKIVDICCGMGGLSLAAKELGFDPILGIDIWEDALETYNANLKGTCTWKDDIADAKMGKRICDFLRSNDVGNEMLYIVSGPPCQGFSIAGKRHHNDPRNSIIGNVATIISKVKPQAALVENVASISHHNFNGIIKNFFDVLCRAGYHVCDIELNSMDFGVPQRRKRRFFFVTRNKISTKSYADILFSQHCKAPTIGEAFMGLPKAIERSENYSPTLSNKGKFNHFAMRHSEKVKAKIASIPIGKGPLSYRKLDPNGHAPTLVSGHRAPPVHFSENRSITAREAARIQGFPDDFQICGAFGTQIQQIANAVPPRLAKVALKSIAYLGGRHG